MRIVWKHLPLDIHPNAPGAHLAAIAADKQGRFWDFHDKLFANQSQLNVEAYRRYARELGLDLERFDRDLLDLENQRTIDDDSAEAAALGLTSTPAFFINGRLLKGAKPFEDFARLIDEELEKQGVG